MGGYACLVDGPEAAMAVANVIAPEHLELLFDGAEELLPLVRAAGAVFCGPWSPASLGDYLAGPNHVLPTNRTARFSSALRADDFRRHIHAVTAGARGPGACWAPTSITLATTEGLPAHAESIRLPAVSAAGRRCRADLAALAGYHSPQVEAAVRLNTNESPFPPPDGWREDAGGRGGRAWTSTATPTARPAALRAGLAELHGVTPDEVFCANGSNEVLQCLLLAFGGPGRRAALFEPTYQLHSHIARITGTEVVAGRPGERPRWSTRRRPSACWARRAPRSPSSARPTTRPAGPSRPSWWPACWTWPRGWWWSTRPTASSPRGRRCRCEPARRRPRRRRAGGGADLLQDLGHGRRPPGLPGGRPRGGGRLRGGRPALPPLGGDPGGRAAGPALPPPRWSGGWPRWPRSGAASPPPWPT